MRKEPRRVAAVAAVFALALGGAAIGGVVARAQVAAPSVTVTLKEFTIAPSAKLRTGKVTLRVVNRGRFPHALAIAGPGAKARTRTLAAGKSATLTVTLRNGTYTLWCPVANHAALGMKLTEQVGSSASASAPAAPTTPPAPTSTSSGGYDPGYGY
jgi:uncharacterized cupredoxin-like copper-binding protein